MMKRINRFISVVLAFSLVLSVSVTALAAGTAGEYLLFDDVDYTKSSAIRVVLNNRQLSFNVNPMVINNTTMVQFRTIFEALGLTVTWDAENQRAIGQNDRFEIILIIDSKIADVNGQAKTMAVPAVNINGNIMVPLRFISETLGYYVVWVGDSNLILISDKNIVEWRYGGYEAAYPYKEYEIKYINGVKTTETRYNGVNHTIEKVNLYSCDGRMVPNVPIFNVPLYGDGWSTKSLYIDKSYWIDVHALTADNWSSYVINTKTGQLMSFDDLKGYASTAYYAKLTVKAQAVDVSLTNICFPDCDLLPEDVPDGNDVGRYDNVLFCLLNDSVQIAIPTSTLIDALIMDGDIYCDVPYYGDYKYVILNQNPRELFHFSDTTWAKIKTGNVWIGMTEEMFLVMINEKPDDIYTYHDSKGTFDEWIYSQSDYSSYYFYFLNAQLYAWYNY